MKYHLGIDPGLSGALALYDSEKPHVAVMGMPTHTITVNGKKKRQIALYQLAQFFDMWASDISKATIEDPHAMPQQGVSSSFNFGFSCGVVQSMVAAHFIPMRLVRPSIWKRDMKLTADKDASRRLASQMFPKFSNLWPLVGDDGKAEATLLAVYGSKS